MLDQIIAIWRALPLAGPALLIGAVVAVWIWRRSSRDSLDRGGSAVLAWWFIFTAATTISPPGGVLDQNAAFRGCDLSDWSVLSPADWFEASPYAVSIWFCVPGGLAAALLEPGRRRRVGLALVALTPVACETAQMLLPMVRRICTSVDLMNNWAGIAVGALVGLTCASWCRRRTSRLAPLWSSTGATKERNGDEA